MTNVNILVVKANWKQYESSKVQKPVAGVAMSHRSVRRGKKGFDAVAKLVENVVKDV